MGEAQYLFIPSAIAAHPKGCENLMLPFQATVEGATRPEHRGTAVAKITVHPVQPGDALPDTLRWPSWCDQLHTGPTSCPGKAGLAAGLHPDAAMWTPGFPIQVIHTQNMGGLKAAHSQGNARLNALNLCPPALDPSVPGVPCVPTTSSAPTSRPTEAPIAVPGVPGVPGSKEAKLKAIGRILDTVARAPKFNISLVDRGSFDSFGPSKSVTENLTYLKASPATRKPHQGQLKSPVAQWDLSSLIYTLPSGRLQHTQRST